MKNKESFWHELIFFLMMSTFTIADGSFEWAQKPDANTELIYGQNATLQWDYFIPNGDVFNFLLISRYQDAKRSYARQTMAIKTADGRVEIYTDFKNHIDITGAATLRINNVEMSDETIYCCEVHYSAKSAISCVQTLMLVPPKITHFPKNTTVLEDTNVILYCNATGIPMPRIGWYRMDLPFELIHSGKTLNLSLSRDDNGVFVCKAWNKVGAANGSAYVDVQYAPIANVSAKSIVANQSDVIKVTCNVTGNPKPSIKWTKLENHTLVLSFESTLILKITGKSVEGRYRCQATNGIGNASHDIMTVFVQNYAPINSSIETCPVNSQVTENQTFVMQCLSTASPSPTYRFYHNQKFIKENRSGYHKICRVKKSHSGNYTCIPVNSYGAGKAVSIQLDVQYPPVVTVHPRTLILREGAVATLKCITAGNPYPNVIWEKEGISGILRTSSILVINGTQRSDTGNYTCRAYNGIGKSAISSSRLEIYYGPEIIIPPTNITITESQNTSLYCEAVGNPEPTITWMKHEGEILKSVNVIQERLKFIHISRSDAGIYVCLVSNIIGNFSVAAKLDVQFKPSNTRLSTGATHDTVKIRDSVTMYCHTDANPPAYLYQFFYGDNLIAITNNGAHHLINVKKEHEGVYHCKATSTFGLGDTANMFLRVQVPSFFEVYPESQTVNEGDSLMLTCVANGDPLPNITWMMLNSSEVISSEPVLSLKNISRSNGGVYVCSASNGVGENGIAVARVRVNYKPNIQVARKSYQRKDSRNQIQLSCTAIGDPLPVIRWSRLPENSTVLSRAISKTTRVSTVTFNITKSLDSVDVVQCFAWNSMGNVFDNVTLRSDTGLVKQKNSTNTWFGLSPLVVLAILTAFMSVFIAAVVMASVYKQRRCGKVVFSK